MPGGHVASIIISGISTYNEFEAFMPYYDEHERICNNNGDVIIKNTPELIKSAMNTLIEDGIEAYLGEHNIFYTLKFASAKKEYKIMKKYIKKMYKNYNIEFCYETKQAIKNKFKNTFSKLKPNEYGLLFTNCSEAEYLPIKKLKVYCIANSW